MNGIPIPYLQTAVGDELHVEIIYPNRTRTTFHGVVDHIIEDTRYDSDGRAFPRPHSGMVEHVTSVGAMHPPQVGGLQLGDHVRTTYQGGETITDGTVTGFDPLLGPVDDTGEPLCLPGTQATIIRPLP